MQRACLDLLAAERIFALRLNTGVFRNAKGRPIFTHSGGAGVADILAFPHGRIVWLEVKSATGRQSPEQASFQRQVESHGHSYLLVRSPDDLLRWLRENRR